jgi:class 3 adenylate cyclase/pimeloyl-ACP methyl ester carboxylesterase
VQAPARKLVAILFTDVAGYTEMMGTDEQRALRALRRSRELVRAEVAARGGRVLDEVGDGSLSSFESAVEAVACALAIQRALRGDPDLGLRIGIHAGDVIVSAGGGVVGDAVNVASRIHGLAAPRQVCVSDRVWEHVRNQPGLRAKPLGEQRLKGVERRVAVWLLEAGEAPERGGRLRRPGRRAAAVAAAAIALAVAGLWATGAWERLALPLLVRLPPLLGSGISQSVGFATASDGVRIAYATSGAGPPIVQAIGWLTHVERGFDSPAYNGWVGRLSQRHRFVRYDGRGTGLSDRGATDFSLEARLRDLEAVVETLRLERFALFGVSAGSPTAIAYAARHPERVSRLVLIGGFASSDSVIAGRPVWGAIEDMMRGGWSAESPAARRMFAALLLPDATPLQQGFVAELMQQSMTGEDAARFLAAGRAVNLGALLPAIRVPTLVVHARGDLTVPLAAAREVAAGIPGARLRVFETSNHAFPQGDPETARMIEEVEDFLAEGDGAGEAAAG